ncbi:hypothetical protein OIU76_024494 [Salix suchowensis]|nr:hypothetical protein OIU76_024494 [Salix suchowensis]
MSQKKSLAERVLKFSKIPNQYLTNCRISSPLRTRIHQRPAQSNTIPHHPGESRIFRRLFHKPASFSPDILKLPIGEGLIDRIRGFDIVKDRIRWDGLSPPPMVMEEVAAEEGLTAEDARKLLKVAQLEGLKLRLREMEKTWISYSEFVRVCSEGCSDLEYGVRVAKNLDESGTVVVLGNLVLLKPEQENETFVVTQARSKGHSVSTVTRFVSYFWCI